MDYKKSGVDIEAGYKSVELMKEAVKSTMREEVLGGLGGFSGAFSLAKIKEITLESALNDPFTLKISLKDPSDKITSIKINDTEIPAADYADNVYEYKVDKYDTYKLYVTAEDAAGNVSATFAADEEGNITSVFTFTLAKKVSVVVWVIIGVAVLLLLGIIIFLIMRRKNNKQAA